MEDEFERSAAMESYRRDEQDMIDVCGIVPKPYLNAAVAVTYAGRLLEEAGIDSPRFRSEQYDIIDAITKNLDKRQRKAFGRVIYRHDVTIKMHDFERYSIWRR
jgi:hypothetical protein